MYLGSWKIDDQITFTVATHSPTNGSGQDADSVPTYHVYEDETATPLITGSMALLNGANTVGFYSEQFQATAAVGFEKGKSYNIYIQAVVGSVTGTITRNFQIEAEVDANTVSVPVTAGMVTGSVLGNVNGSVNSVTLPVGISTGTFLDAIADTVWEELLSGHLVAGSAGHTLFSRMPSGTVLVGDKTGFYLATPQTFNLIGNVSGTFVGNISGSVGEVLTIGATLANKLADHVLRRTFANARASSDGDAVSFRSLLGAIAKLVNRWRILGTTLTVYAEDDTTSLGTQALTGTAGADPITEVDTS